MLTIANASAVWEAIRTGKPTHVRMIFTEQGITLEDSDIDLEEGITISDVLNGDTDLTFGKAVCKQLTARIILSNKTRYMKWTEYFELRFGVEISGNTSWATVGYFTGERPKNISTVDSVDFTAYDAMKKFDTDAADFLANAASATIADLYEDLCDYVGVSYEAHPSDLSGVWGTAFNSATMFSDGSVTCQEILARIAEAAGYYARINSSGKCELVWFEDHTQDITVSRGDQFDTDYSDLYSGMVWDEFDTYTWNEAEEFTWDDVCGNYENNYKPGNVIIRKGSSEQVYPGADRDAYLIENNPIAIAVTNLAKYLYLKISDFGSSLPMTVTCVGNWLVEAGDIIYVQLPERIVPMRIYARTFRWNGAAEDTYETTGQTERTIRK